MVSPLVVEVVSFKLLWVQQQLLLNSKGSGDDVVKVENIVDIIRNSFGIMVYYKDYGQIESCDLLITMDLSDYSFRDNSEKFDKLVNIGYQKTIVGYQKTILGYNNTFFIPKSIWGTKNQFWGTKKQFLDTKNHFWVQKTMFGYHKSISEYQKSFFEYQKSFFEYQKSI